jgi:putative DNA primase/helicase
VVVRYNQIAKDCEVLIPGFACVADESSNASMSKVTDLAIKAGMTSARISEIVFSMAAQNVYCPVQTYIASRAWDGSSRFDQFVGQLVLSRSKFAHLLVRKWLIQAVAAVYEPKGIASSGVIVLTGPQGSGKSRLFKDLTSGVPQTFLEGTTLDPASRDSVMAVVRHWIVELGEIDATFKRSDLAQLKAFITRQEDVLRRPYAQRESTYPRRTVFAGTVNDHSFLHDLTGNRRFWPIEVRSIVRDPGIDYQQLWAEAKTWYDAREEWFLNQRELDLLKRYSEGYVVLDPVVEELLQHYDFQSATAWNPLSMSEICKKIGIDRPTKAQQMQLASAIKKYNGGQPPRTIYGLKRHFVPV